MKLLTGVLFAVGTAILLVYFLNARDGGGPAAQPVPCADITQGCSLPGLKVRALQAPSAMRAFGLEVETRDAAAVSARFEMRDMAMGLNQYRFLAAAPGRWQASVTLPVCIDGRSDWLMLLDVKSISGELQRYQLAFTTAEAGHDPSHDHGHAHHGH